jgi:hypothetical protein
VESSPKSPNQITSTIVFVDDDGQEVASFPGEGQRTPEQESEFQSYLRDARADTPARPYRPKAEKAQTDANPTFRFPR